MPASIPASMVNQMYADLGIPNRFNLISSRFSPEHKPQPKPWYQREAFDHFGVSGRRFNMIWKAAVVKTRAAWDQKGRPAKMRAMSNS